MLKRENKLQNTSSSLNCAQQVLVKYCERYGLKREMAIKIASAFGGGIGLMGETCGAITGALMVIGIKYGSSKDDKKSVENKEKAVNKFIPAFLSLNGSMKCKDLLRLDFRIPKEHKMINENKITENLCPSFINNSIEILDQLLK